MGQDFRLTVVTPEDMIELGERLGEMIFPGAVVGLSGPLGAGKTTLARGTAEGLGIRPGYVVSSPTYTLMQSYPCSRGDMHHLDLYRIETAEDLDSTGFRDTIDGVSILLVEWPEKEPAVLPREHLLIQLDYRDDGREVTLIPSGRRYEKLARRVAAAVRGGR